MANNKAIDEFVGKVANTWRNYGFMDSVYIGRTLYIMCLRKMIESNICQNPQYMSRLVELTKSVFRPTVIDDVDVLVKSADMFEETYHLNHGLISDVLFPLNIEDNMWKRAFFETIQIVSEIIIDNEGYYPYANKLIYSLNKQIKTGSEMVSSNAISELLRLATDIHDGDRVLDGTVGCGYSAMKCLEGKKDIFFLGVDINRNSLAIAAMNAILADVKEYEFMSDDFTAINTPCDMNKVVMDIPFGMKMGDLEHIGYTGLRAREWLDSPICREAEPLLMATAIDSLNETGRFVVIVPPNFLFKQTKSLSTFRDKIVKKGLLKAVVTLPAVHTSSSIKSTMLIIEHGNKDVLFVDATSLFQRERRNDAYISDENKNILKDILDNKKAVKGISFLVPDAKVLEVGDWTLGMYLENEDIDPVRNLEDINAELELEYELLRQLDKKEQKIELFK